MVKRLFKSIAVVAIAAFLFGCAPRTCGIVDDFVPYPLDATQSIAKKNNFLVILDSSRSMQEPYQGVSKFVTAKDVAYKLIRTIPDSKYTGGLRTFGMHFLESRLSSELLYGMAKFSQDDMEDALKTLCRPDGASALAQALEDGIDDLRALDGITAVIIISDGKEIDEAAVDQAKIMKSAYGKSVCFYTLLVGDDEGGKALMQKIASVGKCGFFMKAEELTEEKAMAEFVENVFFTLWTPQNVLFSSNSFDIRDDMRSTLNDVANILKNNRYLQLIIQGYTDSDGENEPNLELSKNRATLVKEYLVQTGINADRLFIEYYGELYPVASNDTGIGMDLNRRVSFKAQ